MDFNLTEDQDALAAAAREFARKEIIPKAAHFDETGEFPRDILERAWKLNLMNIEIP
jgi:acyl-CoA dehydrogenase